MKKARGRQPPDSFCCIAAPTCVLEASVMSHTLADGEGCVRDMAEERVDLALSKASCNSWDQLRTRGFPARASVRVRRVLAIPGKKTEVKVDHA